MYSCHVSHFTFSTSSTALISRHASSSSTCSCRNNNNNKWSTTSVSSSSYVVMDYCNVVLAGLPTNQLNRLQSVLHAAARLMYGASRRDHVKPLLRQLHWLSVPERVEFKLCVLTHRCLHGLGPDYFSSEFTSVSALRPRQRLRSASTAALVVPATRHSTLGDWPGFSCHWRKAVELTAQRHHHCNISVDFSAQTENIFISSIIWQCRLVTTVLAFF